MPLDKHPSHQSLSDPIVSPSAGGSADLLPSSPDLQQDTADVTRPSVHTSNGSSILSSRSTTPSSTTRVEDTDSTGSGKVGLPGVKAGDVSSPSSSPRSSTLDGDMPTTVHPDDVLNHLLNGAKYAVDVDDLVQSARESFQQIVDLYEEKHVSGRPTVISVEKEVRSVYADYLKAIEMSVKVAGHGITFASDAVNLCTCLSQNPSNDIRSFINEMQTITSLAHGDAEDTYKKFSAVRGTLLLIIKRIALQTKQIKDGQDDRKRGRKIDQDPLSALDLLNKTANNVDQVVDCVHKFALWWSNAETMITTLGHQVVSADGRRLSTIRINMVRKSWEVLQKEYEVYKRSINTLSDFYSVDKMRASAPWFKRIFMKKSAKMQQAEVM